MKKLILVLLITLISIFSLAASEIIFVTGEWAPYVSEKLPNGGPYSELILAICKAGGINAKIAFYPWNRAEAMVNDGEAFAAFPYALNADRKAKFDVSETLTYGINNFWYYGTKKINYEKLDDLKGLIIGITQGSFLIKDFEKAGIKYDVSKDSDTLIQKLQLGRIDLIIDEQLVVYDAIKRVFPKEASNFKMMAKAYGEKQPNGLIVSKKYPDAKNLLAKFNEGFKKIKASGEYDKIVNKYKFGK